jgi:hypothetical protein
MKFIHSMMAMVLIAYLTGCASTSQVQEMIDASHRDYSGQLAAHDESITVLKKSAMAGLEQSSNNTEQLVELERKVAGLIQQQAVIQDLANASRVMSAENTVKISGLSEIVTANKEEHDKVIALMAEIDKLYEQVLIQQFQDIADSANAAIESLRKDGLSAQTNAPVKLDEPIEIVAPDTAALTNEAEPALSMDQEEAE